MLPVLYTVLVMVLLTELLRLDLSLLNMSMVKVSVLCCHSWTVDWTGTVSCQQVVFILTLPETKATFYLLQQIFYFLSLTISVY